METYMCKTDERDCKIAYLIQAYNDSNAFKKLCYELLEISNCEIFVHVDKKSEISDFCIDNDKVHYINDREFVSWAGYNQGKLIINLIREALKFSVRFDTYVFLSESDFPVYGKEKIYEKCYSKKIKVLGPIICSLWLGK